MWRRVRPAAAASSLHLRGKENEVSPLKKALRRGFDRSFRHLAVFVISLLVKIKFRVRATVVDMPEPGALILGNHTCIWDFGFLLYAFKQRADERFVATSVQFDKSRFFTWAFRHLGIIRKQQGASDLQSVREMMRASKEGGWVVLYPAGMTSFDGRQAGNALPGTGQLPKLLRTGVYTAIVNGGFLSAPRYLKGSLRGRVEITVKRLLSAEEAAKLSADEIQARVNEALRFNDWDWQEKNRVPFKGIQKMDGVWRQLYYCPECGQEGAIKQGKGTLYCEKCHFSALRDEYGFFHREGKTGPCPSRMDEWTDMELTALRKNLEDPGYALSQNGVRYMTKPEGASQATNVDSGEMRLSRGGLDFDGQSGHSLHFGINDFQFLISDDISTLRLNTGGMSHLFYFADPSLMNKWIFMHQILKGEGACRT